VREGITAHDIITKMINPELNRFLTSISGKYAIPPERVIEGVYIYSRSKFSEESWIWSYIHRIRETIYRKYGDTNIDLKAAEGIVSEFFFALHDIVEDEDYEKLLNCFTRILRRIRKDRVEIKIFIKPSKIFSKGVEIIDKNDKRIVKVENANEVIKLHSDVYWIQTYRKFLFLKFSKKEETIFLLSNRTIRL